MGRTFFLFIVYLSVQVFISCGNSSATPEPDINQGGIVETPHLPIMGEMQIEEREENGTIVYDTIYHAIPDFAFTNQDGKTVTQADYANKVYIADFFFTTCPTICPKMATTLGMIQEKMKGTSGFGILSHTIDPDHDSPSVLKAYAQKQNADPAVWTFVTGDKSEIYEICEYSYMAYAKPDAQEPGGYIHSGFLVLIDKNKHIRGVYDGTRQEIVDTIVQDIHTLLNEK